jgi:hypothetical protein
MATLIEAHAGTGSTARRRRDQHQLVTVGAGWPVVHPSPTSR